MCQKVVKYFDSEDHTLLLAVEPLQWRGRIPIARPHCHLLIIIDPEGAEDIAAHFRTDGFDVDVRSIYEPDIIAVTGTDRECAE